ncbi:DUF397 domain-containing protein [Amycolatopsis sp. CA-230715]|uniref:DUF397 domain-containing protein n=1 Tax=Amycolatopsis sp. CA-230715 TaxID=2745196 RepID=UPI001C01A238|nr:DUF397 domain-containing protein [Amycolatopsis sp. CA-230715]QWF82546.1 hypothetical protein HUW46_05984 [Amycolatopsis sp. CA-230715]
MSGGHTPVWRKSSYSNPKDDCIEVALVAPGIAVRDSKSPTEGVLRLSPNAWRVFLQAHRRIG